MFRFSIKKSNSLRSSPFKSLIKAKLRIKLKKCRKKKSKFS